MLTKEIEVKFFKYFYCTKMEENIILDPSAGPLENENRIIKTRVCPDPYRGPLHKRFNNLTNLLLPNSLLGKQRNSTQGQMS